MQGTETTNAFPENGIAVEISAIREFCKNTHLTLEAKYCLSEWLDALFKPELRLNRKLLSDIRFLHREMQKLLRACNTLASSLPHVFGGTTVEKLGSGAIPTDYLWDKRTLWDTLPHSLNQAEIAAPVGVLQQFFQYKSYNDWLEVLEDLDDAAMCCEGSFTDNTEEGLPLLQIRDQLSKLFEAAFLLLIAVDVK